MVPIRLFRAACFAGVMSVLVPIASSAGLIAYWSFDGCTGTDSASGYDVSVFGSPLCSTGSVGQAWTLDGATQYLERTGAGAFVPNTSAWSVSTWVRSDADTSRLSAVVSWYRCGANAGCTTADAALWSIWISHGHPEWYLRDDAVNEADLVDPTVSLSDGKWHHVVGTLSAGHDHVRLYVDGALKQDFQPPAFTTLNGTAPLEIGRWFRIGWGVPDYYFPGSVDEVRIYDSELSASEVAALYGSGTTSVPRQTDDALAIDRIAPNPVRASFVRMRFRVGDGPPVRVTLIDVLGRAVMERTYEHLAAGAHELALDGRGTIPPGVYQVRVQQGRNTVSRPVTLLR
jgi:hypothetical protein